MPKKNFNAQQDKIVLGKLIAKLRADKNISLRQMAQGINIPPSNLTYIEDGRNVPTANVYSRIIDFLKPINKVQKQMDDLYTKIRHAPPPDVCNILMENKGLGERIKLLQDISLSPEQLSSIEELFASFMALGNMGLAYMNYARVLSNEEGYIRDCLNHYALKLLNDAIESNDPNIHAEAKVYYVGHVALFSADYREYLQKDIVLPEAPKLTKAETEYRKWCIDNGLFLNSLSDLPCKELAFAFDGLTLPPILTSLHAELPIIIGMFNQLKQEYVSARYTFYESLEFKGRPHFSDKRTSIAETLEYAQFSLRVERLKSAFKTLFGILDKTAFFLNEYYELGIKSKDVNFKTVWQSEIKSKNGYKFKNTLDDSNNFALGSLHWIQREFEKSSDQYASPQYVRLKEVRNALEHRYTIVTMLTKNPDEIKKNDVAMYICETELYNLTFDLLKIVREAIICLALCVTIKEREKKEAADSDRIMTQKIHQVDDEFKI